VNIARLADVADVIAGQSPPSSTYNHTGHGLPFFQGKADFGPSNPTARVWCTAPERIAEPHDVLVSVRAPVGPVNVARERCGIGRGLAAIRARPHLADPDYLSWVLRWNERALVALGSGSTFAAVTRRDLDSLLVPLPPLDEQRRIAARVREQLHEVHGLVASATAQDEELAHLRTRVYEAAFPVTPLSVTAESANPDGWTWRSLGSLGRLESGHTPSRSRPDWWGGDIPWIALPDIRALDGRQVFETQEHTNPEGIAHSAARVLPAGTVVLSRTASVGFVTIMGRPMATSRTS
jgi:type I restriction enzyme S subunit